MTAFPAYKAALRSWLVTALPGKTVIYGRQNAPKPPLSFVAVHTLALVPVGMPDYDMVQDAEGDKDRRQHYRASLAVHFYGTEAETMCTDAHRSLGSESVHDAFRTAGFGFQGTEGITDATQVVDGRWEDHWTFDAYLGMIATDTERLSWIAHVEGELVGIGSKTIIVDFTVN